MPITQWTRDEGGNYMAAGPTQPDLPPGIYEPVTVPQVGLVWLHIEARTDAVVTFAASESERVVEEIDRFWQEEATFRRYSLPFKRGILLHGPPGSGKSSTLRLVAERVVDAGGYVVLFNRPGTLIQAVRQLRAIHPDARVVVLMEDVDAILAHGDESAVLNLLDGAEEVDKMVFLATTNYPEQLKERIRNRPSRFDRRVLIPHPSDDIRRQYLTSLLLPGDEYDVDRYVKDTAGLSLAHVKELFVATAILGADYGRTLRELRGMNEPVNSATDSGFERPGTYA